MVFGTFCVWMNLHGRGDSFVFYSKNAGAGKFRGVYMPTLSELFADSDAINQLAKGFSDGYSIPINLNTSALNPYDEDFVIFVVYKTGTICNSYQKSFKKPITINGLEVKNYPKN